MTSQYFTMFITQLHTPLAAGDLASMTYGVNDSKDIYKVLTNATLVAGTKFESTTSLNPFSLSTNCSGDFIIF